MVVGEDRCEDPVNPMELALHPDFKLTKLAIGREQAPLVVIDNFVANPEALVDMATEKLFGDVVDYYPGVRSKAPLTSRRQSCNATGPPSDFGPASSGSNTISSCVPIAA